MSNYITRFIIGFSFFISLITSGQTISGTVFSENNKPLNNASVLLKNKENNTLTYQITKNNGEFSFHHEGTDTLYLHCNALGFEKQIINIIPAKDLQKLKIILLEKTEQLQEIIIETSIPICEKKDTIVFNAKSFLDGTEYSVEDLLKKLPGVQVSENGTIKIGNQEIEKIMVEGDDFFEKGYKILSKNMPVNPLKNVEILKNYSNNKHLKGVENSDRVAINLTLEDDYKRKWFGNAQGSYGAASANRYALRSNLMNFGKNDKYYFLTSLNNLGNVTSGDLSSLIYSSNEPVIGDGLSAYKMLSLSESSAALNRERTRFNNNEMISLNSIFSLSEKTKLKVVGFFNTDENNFYKYNQTWFSDATTSFVNTEDYFMRKKERAFFGKTAITHDFSKTSTLEVSSGYHYGQNKDKSSIVFNEHPLNEDLLTESHFSDTKFVYTTKLSDRKVLMVSGRYLYDKKPQNYVVNQFVYQDLFQNEADGVQQFSENTMRFLGAEVRYLDRRSKGHLFEISANVSSRTDDLYSKLSLISPSDNLSINDFQNDITLKNNALQINVLYAYQWMKDIRIVPSVQFKYVHQKLENKISLKSYRPFLIDPSISLNWDINNKNKIQAYYRYSWQTSELIDLYSNTIHTGFRSFSKGYNDFVKFGNHNATLAYNYGAWMDRFLFAIMIGYSQADKYFSSQSILTQNYSITEPVILRDRTSLFSNATVDYYLKFMKTNMKIKGNYSHSNYQNYVNASEIRSIKSSSLGYGVELRSGFSGMINYHIGSNWDEVRYETETKKSYVNNRTFLNFTLRLHSKIFATLKNERYYFGYLTQTKKDFYLSDFTLDYKRNDKVNYGFVINNIFDNDEFVSYQLTDISQSATRYQLIGRYALLKAEIRF